MRPLLLSVLLLSTLPAAAAPEARVQDTHLRALAAGYKALTLCSAHFSGGRAQADIEALELRGIVPELQPLVETLPTSLDPEARTVSVRFDEALPPRIAAWRPNLGCSQLPVGADIAMAALLPRFDTAAPDLDARPWPLGDRDAHAAPRGDGARLETAIAAAFDPDGFGNGHVSTAVLVVQGGRIVAERYRQGFGPHVAQRTWSVAKSFNAAVIGVAVAEGAVDPARPARVPEWQAPGDPRAAITIDQLMRMASGLHSDTAGNRTDALYFGGGSVAATATHWPLTAPPGTRFRYANNDTVLSTHALRAATGDDARMLARPFTGLFWPLGMTRTWTETDWRGGQVSASQVWSTARDFARFGLLHLHDGVFDGRRLLPEGWVARVTTPSGPQPEQGFGYGAGFWLLGGAPGVPEDAYAAFGNRGQYIVIVPSRDVVLVRRGEDPAGHRFDVAAFAAQALAALD